MSKVEDPFQDVNRRSIDLGAALHLRDFLAFLEVYGYWTVPRQAVASVFSESATRTIQYARLDEREVRTLACLFLSRGIDPTDGEVQAVFADLKGRMLFNFLLLLQTVGYQIVRTLDPPGSTRPLDLRRDADRDEMMVHAARFVASEPESDLPPTVRL